MVSITRKRKEIGIRTVLGASIQQIVWLFSREFSWLMLLANLIAWPMAWLLLKQWLANYAYQVPIGALPFVTTGLIIALLTGLIIVFLVFKKAVANPVESLRSE